MRYDLFALALVLRFLKIGCARAALRYDKRAKMAKI
jgi:hypothetical protein